MAGRRRRASTSTVATIDQQDTVRHYKERSILKPVSADTHSDDWPCFLLLDATVHRLDGSLVNQLHVDLEGPFVVRGRLDLEMDNAQYLIKRNIKRKALWIQVEYSYTFSVGTKNDTLVPVIWASGAAGWFEIVPSKAYRPICDIMFQAAILHYSFLDQYETALEQLQKSKKKKKATMADVDIDLDELLFKYALRAGDGLTIPEAYERLHEHSSFILSHFPKEAGVTKYLANIYPDVVQELAERIARDSKRTVDPATVLLKAYEYSHREESSSIEVSDGSKKGKDRTKNTGPKNGIPKTTIPKNITPKNTIPKNTIPKPAGPKSPLSDVIIADMPKKSNDVQKKSNDILKKSNETPKQSVETPKKSNEALSSRTARMKRRFLAEIAREEDDVIMVDPPNTNPPLSRRLRQRAAQDEDSSTVGSNGTLETNSSIKVLVDALEDVRKRMLQLISEGKQKKQLHKIPHKTWRLKVFLECNIKNDRCLEEVFLYHARDLANLLGPEWHNTEIYRWAKENASKPPTLSAMSEEEMKQLTRRSRPPALEPRTEDTSQSDISSYFGKQVPIQGRPSGKAAGLRPSTSSKKRLRHELDFEDEMEIDEDEFLKKKPKKAHYFSEGESDEQNDSGVVDDVEEDSSSDSKLDTGNSGSLATQLVIRAERLPSARAQGPNQTWTCEEPGCFYVVRAAHEEQGQKLISIHYEEHERDAQDVAQEIALDRVSLAFQEAKGHMPINHLLEKIRNLSEKSKRSNDLRLNGHPVPEPIKKSLLV
ncbi:hypothetical protein F4861DRAFT_516712 [Xylaria intraflava]|nr:hypothetical protein F4861DRAFT_516712 [Xylaria intraflava]